jgi:hypothetical protein
MSNTVSLGPVGMTSRITWKCGRCLLSSMLLWIQASKWSTYSGIKTLIRIYGLPLGIPLSSGTQGSADKIVKDNRMALWYRSRILSYDNEPRIVHCHWLSTPSPDTYIHATLGIHNLIPRAPVVPRSIYRRSRVPPYLTLVHSQHYQSFPDRPAFQTYRSGDRLASIRTLSFLIRRRFHPGISGMISFMDHIFPVYECDIQISRRGYQLGHVMRQIGRFCCAKMLHSRGGLSTRDELNNPRNLSFSQIFFIPCWCYWLNNAYFSVVCASLVLHKIIHSFHILVFWPQTKRTKSN